MSNLALSILKTISYACVFITGAYGIYKIENDKDKKSGLEAFVIDGKIGMFHCTSWILCI